MQLHFTQAVLLSYSDECTVLFSLWDPDDTQVRLAVIVPGLSDVLLFLKLFFLFVSVSMISINHLHVD